MKRAVYLFKTDGEPIHFNLVDKNTGVLMMVYIINPALPKFKMCSEPVINKIYIDPSFQTESWFWKSYMPALNASGTILYDFIQNES